MEVHPCCSIAQTLNRCWALQSAAEEEEQEDEESDGEGFLLKGPRSDLELRCAHTPMHPGVGLVLRVLDLTRPVTEMHWVWVCVVGVGGPMCAACPLAGPSA